MIYTAHEPPSPAPKGAEDLSSRTLAPRTRHVKPFDSSGRSASLTLASATTFGIVLDVPTCRFCPRATDDQFALTAREPGGDWARVVESACLRCLALLRYAGADGLRLKATGETWYLGHGRGLYDAPHERQVL